METNTTATHRLQMCLTRQAMTAAAVIPAAAAPHVRSLSASTHEFKTQEDLPFSSTRNSGHLTMQTTAEVQTTGTSLSEL